MKRITILTTLMILLMAGSAFAQGYTCICIGAKDSYGNCGFGYRGAYYGWKKTVPEDEIGSYLPKKSIEYLKSNPIALSQKSGWVCAKN